jgi:hypothetical protein
MNKKIGIILVFVVSLGIVIFTIFNFQENKNIENSQSKQNLNNNQNQKTSEIYLVVLDGSELMDTVEGELFGCNDKLLAVDLGVNKTPRETLQKLLTYDNYEGLYNVFANIPNVAIEDFNIDNGNAVVKLVGDGLGGGACDAPRIVAQIHKTLLQFDEINEVEMYFNNEPFETYLSEKDEELVLSVPQNDGIYFGAFPDFGGPEDNVTAQKIGEFNKLAGKKIAWAYFSNNWGIDGIKFPREKVEIIESTGSVPFVRMMPRKNFDTTYDKAFSLQKIIDGKFDEDLYKYANDVREYGNPVLIDFAVEMNGDWFPWSGVVNGGAKKDGYGDMQKADGPERFVDAYRHIMDIFRQENVTNVTWFFHPDIYSYPENQSWNDPKEYYPGDDYIDWIGVSIYGPLHPGEDYWQNFSEIIKEREDKIMEISNSKPLALLEFGVTDYHPLGDKKSWIVDAFNTILNKNNLLQFKAISWWHENWEEEDNLWATLRIDSSLESRAIFLKYATETSRFTSNLIFE